jgi:hypothetical protein
MDLFSARLGRMFIEIALLGVGGAGKRNMALSYLFRTSKEWT